MTSEVIKEATRDLFGYLGNFDKNWDEGWRPVLTDDGDILFRSGLGSYVRSRKNENDHRFAFKFLWGQLLFTATDMVMVRRDDLAVVEKYIDHDLMVDKGDMLADQAFERILAIVHAPPNEEYWTKKRDGTHLDGIVASNLSHQGGRRFE